MDSLIKCIIIKVCAAILLICKLLKRFWSQKFFWRKMATSKVLTGEDPATLGQVLTNTMKEKKLKENQSVILFAPLCYSLFFK